MLVLTRRVDESIAIGDSITLTVLAIEGDRVKLGIKAPRDILILRQEVFQAVQDQSRLQEHLAAEPVAPDTFDELRKLLSSSSEEEDPSKDEDK